MRFEYSDQSWLLFLIPVLIIGLYLMSRIRQRSTQRFVDLSLWDRLIPLFSRTRRFWKTTMVVTAIFFIILTLLRPQYGTRMEQVVRQGQDIFIALDVSKSMLAQDVFPSRFDWAVREIHSFVAGLKGDRIGLIVFSGEAAIQCPLTSDYSAFKLFLEDVKIGHHPVPGTQLGEMIALARKRFKKEKTRTKVLIVLTDGETFDDKALDEAQKAQDEGLLVFTIGLGSLNGEPIPLFNKQGQLQGYKRDKQNNVILSRLNADLLQSIARITDGAFYHVDGQSLALDKVYRTLSKLDKNQLEEQVTVTYIDRFQIPLFIAFCLLLGDFVFSPRKRRHD